MGNIFRKAAIVVLVTGMGGGAVAADSDWTGNANFFAGAKALDENDWSPAEEQGEVGFGVDFRQKSWPMNISIGYLRGSGEGPVFGSTFKSETTELQIGVKKIWDDYGTLHPFLEGGLAFVSGKGSSARSISGSGTGLWLGGGVYWVLAEQFNLGLRLQSSSAKATISGYNAEVGGGHFGVIAGFHW